MSPFPQYRSKVLTALMRQLGSLRDRTEAVIRHAQVIGRWSLEAALYPLYRWEHVRQTIGRQLGQTFRKVTKPLSSSHQDHPVLSASDSIEDVLNSIQFISPSSEANHETVSGQPSRFSNWLEKGLTKLGQISRFVVPTFRSNPSTAKLVGSDEKSANHAAIIPTPPIAKLKWLRGSLSRVKHMTQGFIQRINPTTSPAVSSGKILKVQALSTHCKVQGIATSLKNKNLVFVTSEQAILDILTPQQQAILRQKINWAIHHYGIRLRLQQGRRWLAHGWEQLSTQRPIEFLQSFKPNLFFGTSQNHSHPILSKTRQLIPQLKHWVIRGAVGAIASLPFVAIPAIAAESVPQPNPSQKVKAQWVDPNHLKTQLSWDELQGMTFQQTQSQGWLTNVRKTPSSLDQQVRPPHAPLDQSFYAPDNRIEIPIEAEFLGYEPHLLEQVLAWLDTLLVRMEQAIALAWRWLGLIIVVGMTAMQKVRQRMFG